MGEAKIFSARLSRDVIEQLDRTYLEAEHNISFKREDLGFLEELGEIKL